MNNDPYSDRIHGLHESPVNLTALPQYALPPHFLADA